MSGGHRRPGEGALGWEEPGGVTGGGLPCVEEGGMADIFDQPFHPYTQGLLKSMPRLGDRSAGVTIRLNEITGTVPAATQKINGCKFADRCSYVFELCKELRPDLFQIRQDHRARCWLKRHPERRTQRG